MKISIITINRNNRAGLEATMASVLEQTYGQVEYLVVDGGSTDGSADVIAGHTDRLAYWVSEPDRGVYHAMNKGIERATGEYLLFLNSGDRLMDRETLAHVQPHLTASIVYGDLRFDTQPDPIDYAYPDRLTFSFFCERSLGHPATFIKKSLFEQLGPYDETYPICADWAFFIQAICLYGATNRHMHILVSRFDTSGMSSVKENQVNIEKEKIQLLSSTFSCFYDDYLQLIQYKSWIERLMSSKGYKLLRRLGVKKFRR